VVYEAVLFVTDLSRIPGRCEDQHQINGHVATVEGSDTPTGSFEAGNSASVRWDRWPGWRSVSEFFISSSLTNRHDSWPILYLRVSSFLLQNMNRIAQEEHPSDGITQAIRTKNYISDVDRCKPQCQSSSDPNTA